MEEPPGEGRKQRVVAVPHCGERPGKVGHRRRMEAAGDGAAGQGGADGKWEWSRTAREEEEWARLLHRAGPASGGGGGNMNSRRT